MEQNTVKQTENFGEVVGLLKKKELKLGTSTKTNNDYANGHIEVEVNTKFGISVLRIDFMEMAIFGTSKKENKSYKRLKTVMSDYKSIEEHGRENADMVRVFVKVEENNYYKDGEIVEGTRLLASTNFDKGVFLPIEKVEKTVEQKAEISFGGMITKITPNDTTGELKIDMVGAGYKGNAIKHSLVVSKELASGFMGIYQENCVTVLHYMPINSVEVKEVTEQVAFGTAPTHKITNTTRKNLVCGGNNVDYASDLTREKVTQMLTIRSNELEELKENAKKNASMNTTPTGFGDAQQSQGTSQPQFGAENPFGGSSVSGNPFGGI